jgi:2-methylcitrate dehydratase PrpD
MLGNRSTINRRELLAGTAAAGLASTAGAGVQVPGTMQSADGHMVLAIAREAMSYREGELPPEVVKRAKQCLLDQFAVQLRGATLPQVAPVWSLVSDSVGKPQATVAYHGLRTTVFDAALANGTFGHSCEYDDSHYDCGHPGVCVIPAALAMAELLNASGRDLLVAVVTGYQAMVRAVGPIHRSTLDTGWHCTKVGGVFGAAAAAASLAGFEAATCAHALSVAASDASGTMEYDQSGGEIKRVHAGLAARSGLQAARLAQFGLTGPTQILEGRRGIHRLFGGGKPADLEPFRGGRFHILDTIFKLYPSVGTHHAALRALSRLQERLGFTAAQVRSVDVGLSDWAIPHGATITRPHDSLSAQFSLTFSLGLRLVRGGNRLADYLDPASWTDPAILAAGDLVRTYPVDMPTGSSQLGARVRVTLADGRSDEIHQPHMPGSPADPASDAQLRDKFHELVDGLMSPARVNRLIELVENLEAADELSELTSLLTVDASKLTAGAYRSAKENPA